MNSKTIIRIEHPEDGWGFWRRKNQNKKIVEYGFLNSLIQRHSEFKTPFEEGLFIRKDNKEWVCAFKSLDQLTQWVWPSELNTLINLGYKVLEFEVEEYQEGEHQVLFTKESIIENKDLTNSFI